MSDTVHIPPVERLALAVTLQFVATGVLRCNYVHVKLTNDITVI